jgi:hypothetical protein
MTRRTLFWIGLGVATLFVTAIAAWNISLALERQRCDAKSNAELLGMARHAAQSVAPEMGAVAVNPNPTKVRFHPNDTARAEFAFVTADGHRQTAEVSISRNCHVMVGWLSIMPPLR